MIFIDFLVGLLEGAVLHHAGLPEICPLASMGRFLSLMGRFPSSMGRFPECLNGAVFPLKNPLENSPSRKGALTGRPWFGSVRLRFGDGTVQAVPVFGSGGSSAKKPPPLCMSVQFNRKGRFRFRFRFLENGSGGSGYAFGFRKNGSDGSGFRFRFGS